MDSLTISQSGKRIYSYSTETVEVPFRAAGTEPPSLYMQEDQMPDDVRALFLKLKK
jgi:hypothetical protein